MLDGLSSVKDHIITAKSLGYDSLALTDHGNIHGAVEFYRTANENGIHPVIGCELYSIPFGIGYGDKTRSANHLLVLAKNDIGYKNILKLSKESFVDGYYYKPRVTTNSLANHSDGLITTSGCMAAHIPSAILNGDLQQAESMFKWYLEVFGDRFYVELQIHPGIPEINAMNTELIRLAKKYNVKTIITNDAHYARREDAKVHDILLCVQTRSDRNNSKRFRFTDDEYHLKSIEETINTFKPYMSILEIEEAMNNAYDIAHMCNANPTADSDSHIPSVDLVHLDQDIVNVTDTMSPDEFLRQLTYANIAKVYNNADQAVIDKIEEELKIIEETKFASYFLIIWDICNAASRMGIGYNTRGSAAGSIINYIIGVSFVDPIDKKLMFSRFLNKYRVSIPDCDLDFEDDRRQDIMEYIVNKYGEDRVCQVITFGKMKARASIRDVGRAMGMPLATVDRIAKSIVNTPGKPIDLKNSVDRDSEYYSPEFHKLIHANLDNQELYNLASSIETTVRHSGIHAAALLIGDIPLVERIPLMTSKTAKTVLVSQFDYPISESIGMLKVDLLGLITLRIIRETIKLINKRHGLSLSMNSIEPDESAFDLLRNGDTIGVFQVENSGLTRYLVQMMPSNFGHVADMISLYRPGPIGYIPNYINRLHGVESTTLKHPLLEAITADTMGIMIYQEQVNQVLMELGGYNAGDADKVRKAISKKSVADIDKNRKIFVDGASKNGIDAKVADSIYDDINEFALYGFNRAHAASYARITLITAWLKANYTSEYITACLICEGGDNGKRTKYIQDAIRHNITVLAPRIGGSPYFDLNDDGEIEFGLSSIDGISEKTAQQIANTDMDNIYTIGLKKNQIEKLVWAGCFDELGDRQVLSNNVDNLAEHAKRIRRWSKIGQGLLYYPDLKVSAIKNSEYDTAMMEYGAIGTWIKFHPIHTISKRIRDNVTRIPDITNEDAIVCVITRLEELVTRKNHKRMYKFIGVDEYGSIEILLNSRLSTDDRHEGDILHLEITKEDDSNTAFAKNMTVLWSK